MEEDLSPADRETAPGPVPASGSNATTTQRGPVVGECDFRQAGQLSPEQVRQLSALHQTFATSLAGSLSAYLRVALETKFLGVEQIPYREFVSRLPEQAYVASISMVPAEELVAIQLDLSLLLPMIDLLLGGSGRGPAEPRELTEIEEQVLETLLAIICRELKVAWQPVLQVQFEPEKRVKQAHVPKLNDAEDRTLYLSFEMVLNDTRGLFTLVLSSTTTAQLLRQLGQQGASPRRLNRSHTNDRLRERLLDCALITELHLPRLALRIGEIVDLRPGQILSLRYPINNPLLFSVNGLGFFEGSPVSCGTLRGALLHQKPGSANSRSNEPS
jgi:flagellar motor switch protein FliM